MWYVVQKLKIFSATLMVTGLFISSCSRKSPVDNQPPPVEKSLVNTAHLDYLYTPVVFAPGINAAGIYIYSEYPDYKPVADSDEGFSCVDDVSRAALVYLRSDSFDLNESVRIKAYNLLSFILEMQAPTGYFYNFLLPGDLINKYHPNSIAGKNWWSWRAFQTLAEAAPRIRSKNSVLASLIDIAINKIISNIKAEMIGLPLTTKNVNGITVPEWLPLNSASDQAATLIIALISYCTINNDAELISYISKLADGIVMMQQGDAENFPYGCFLSWENQWHAYGNDQAYALLKAGVFLNNSLYTEKALLEIDGFYPWLIDNGYKADIVFNKTADTVISLSENKYSQISYAMRPMVFAAVEAYQSTGNEKYADMAGQLAAWLFGANDAGINMYSPLTGRCFDGLSSSGNANKNAGAESTIEALLALQIIEKYPSTKKALDKFKK